MRKLTSAKETLFSFTTVLTLCTSVFFVSSCLNKPKQEEPLICGVKAPPVNVKEAPAAFKAKCATCHMLDKSSTGPKLQGVLKRIPTEAWFAAFLRNEDSLVRVGDPYTLKINEVSPIKFKHDFKKLEEAQLEELKTYVR